jgi:HK97 family phage major capsid protein
MRSKEIREKLGEAAKQIRDMADLMAKEGRDFNAEENTKFEALSKDYDSLARQLKVMERADALDAITESKRTDPIRPDGKVDTGTQERAKRPSEVRDTAHRAWMRAHQPNKPEITEVEQEALRSSGFTPYQKEIRLDLLRGQDYARFRSAFTNGPRCAAESRVMSAVDGTSGGFMVAPSSFAAQLEFALLAYGGVREVATVIRTDTGAALPFPTVNDTSNEGEQLGESEETGTQDIAVGIVKLSEYKFGSKAILVPFELMNDSFFSIEGMVSQTAGERLGRITNRRFTVGTGASQPKGIVAAATNGKTAAGSTSFTADEMLDLLGSVDPAYRNQATWMFNDATMLAIRKLKTGDGQYLWQAGLSSGVPDMVFGHGYTINQHMASAASGEKPLLFGNFKKYVIRDVGQLRLARTDDRYWEKDQTAFVAYMRCDGGLIDAGTNPVKCMTMT